MEASEIVGVRSRGGIMRTDVTRKQEWNMAIAQSYIRWTSNRFEVIGYKSMSM